MLDLCHVGGSHGMRLVAFSVVFFGSDIGVSHLIVGNVDDVVAIVVVRWIGIFLFSVDVSFSQCSEGMSPSGDPQMRSPNRCWRTG